MGVTLRSGRIPEARARSTCRPRPRESGLGRPVALPTLPILPTFNRRNCRPREIFHTTVVISPAAGDFRRVRTRLVRWPARVSSDPCWSAVCLFVWCPQRCLGRHAGRNSRGRLAQPSHTARANRSGVGCAEGQRNGNLDGIRPLSCRLDRSTGLGPAATRCANVSRAVTAPVGASEGREGP